MPAPNWLTSPERFFSCRFVHFVVKKRSLTHPFPLPSEPVPAAAFGPPPGPAPPTTPHDPSDPSARSDPSDSGSSAAQSRHTPVPPAPPVPVLPPHPQIPHQFPQTIVKPQAPIRRSYFYR